MFAAFSQAGSVHLASHFVQASAQRQKTHNQQCEWAVSNEIAHFQNQANEMTFMNVKEIKENKKKYIRLLLLADEQEDMIDRYLEKGTMYVLEDDGVKAECVVLDMGGGVLEIKNIATVPAYQGKGYGKALIEFIVQKYQGEYAVLQVGTGDSPATIPFYEKCGFMRSHRIKNFFVDNYDHPIYDGGVQLIDMVYLQKNI